LLTLVDGSEGGYLQDMAAYLSGFGAGSAAFGELQDLVARIASLSGPVCVLVKGSRFARMERVVEGLGSAGDSLC
jgi:hypothetical protein